MDQRDRSMIAASYGAIMEVMDEFEGEHESYLTHTPHGETMSDQACRDYVAVRRALKRLRGKFEKIADAAVNEANKEKPDE